MEEMYRYMPQQWRQFKNEEWFPYVYIAMADPNKDWLNRMIDKFEFWLWKFWASWVVYFMLWVKRRDIGNYINNPNDAMHYFEETIEEAVNY